MPAIHATVTAPPFRARITEPLLAIDLPERHMRVEIGDSGHIRVVQESYDLLDGAPAPRNTPRYVQGGQYEFTLPDCADVNRICDTGGIPPASPDFPAEGSFTIAATHRHG